MNAQAEVAASGEQITAWATHPAEPAALTDTGPDVSKPEGQPPTLPRRRLAHRKAEVRPHAGCMRVFRQRGEVP
jgi:hypothetical protein